MLKYCTGTSLVSHTPFTDNLRKTIDSIHNSPPLLFVMILLYQKFLFISAEFHTIYCVLIFAKVLYIVVFFNVKKAGIFQPANFYLFNTSPIILTILSFLSCLSNVTFIPSAFKALKNSSAHSILYPSALRRSASCS